jgi:hypothetical protein
VQQVWAGNCLPCCSCRAIHRCCSPPQTLHLTLTQAQTHTHMCCACPTAHALHPPAASSMYCSCRLAVVLLWQVLASCPSMPWRGGGHTPDPPNIPCTHMLAPRLWQGLWDPMCSRSGLEIACLVAVAGHYNTGAAAPHPHTNCAHHTHTHTHTSPHMFCACPTAPCTYPCCSEHTLISLQCARAPVTHRARHYTSAAAAPHPHQLCTSHTPKHTHMSHCSCPAARAACLVSFAYPVALQCARAPVTHRATGSTHGAAAHHLCASASTTHTTCLLLHSSFPCMPKHCLCTARGSQALRGYCWQPPVCVGDAQRMRVCTCCHAEQKSAKGELWQGFWQPVSLVACQGFRIRVQG